MSKFFLFAFESLGSLASRPECLDIYKTAYIYSSVSFSEGHRVHIHISDSETIKTIHFEYTNMDTASNE